MKPLQLITVLLAGLAAQPALAQEEHAAAPGDANKPEGKPVSYMNILCACLTGSEAVKMKRGCPGRTRPLPKVGISLWRVMPSEEDRAAVWQAFKG